VARRVNAAVVNPRRDRHVLGPQPQPVRESTPAHVPAPLTAVTLTPSCRGTPRGRETPYNRASLLPAGGKAKQGVASEPQQSRDLSSFPSRTHLSPPSPRRPPSPLSRQRGELRLSFLPIARPPASSRCNARPWGSKVSSIWSRRLAAPLSFGWLLLLLRLLPWNDSSSQAGRVNAGNKATHDFLSLYAQAAGKESSLPQQLPGSNSKPPPSPPAQGKRVRLPVSLSTTYQARLAG
jgi:hypothetical protein